MKKIISTVFFGIRFILLGILMAGFGLWATSRRPNKEYEIVFNKEVACARNHGFRFITPIFREMSPWMENSTTNWGVTFNLVNIVIVRNHYDFKATIAHELGHVIDFEMWRRGHPDFQRMQNLSSEEFADEIGQIILDHCPEVQNP